MAHLAVTVTLLFFACVHAGGPAPEPDKAKFTAVKNSKLGIEVADKHAKAHGLVDSGKGLDTPIESPVDTGNNVPDTTVVDNVNGGFAFASGGSAATGLITDPKKKDSIPIFG